VPHNDLWETLTQGAMMVDLGEPEILERQVPQAGYSLSDANSSLPHPF
jgi:hypothetical protein